MSSNTPSGRRREGRNAFQPCVDPEDACPYNRTRWNYESHYADFLDGWLEAAVGYEASQEEEDEPCCAYCLKLKEEVDELRGEVNDLRVAFEIHTGDYDEDYG